MRVTYTPGDRHHQREETTVARMRVCSTPGCPNLHRAPGRCPHCRAKADRARRPDGNPYATEGHRAFRHQVLTRDPICVNCLTRRSTVADHYPHERKDLIEMGLNPNDPQYGQGLCAPCHDSKTARTASGWSDR